MAAIEPVFPFSGISVVEDVLMQNLTRLSDIDLVSRKSEDASLKRYEAAEWLRKTVGVVGGKNLPAEPSEEEFRLGLRSGIVLCNVLNKIQPGSVPKVIDNAFDAVVVTDGAALSAYQYFENVRNFLVAMEELGLSTFEASDLEKGGETTRIVNCVLALKSYNSWKEGGCIGSLKNYANAKAATPVKHSIRKNEQLLMNSIAKSLLLDGFENSLYGLSSAQSSFSDFSQVLNDMSSCHSLNILVRTILMDKKQEEIPDIVESILSKVIEEFEQRIANQDEAALKNAPNDIEETLVDSPYEMGVRDIPSTGLPKEEWCNQSHIQNENTNPDHSKCKMLLEQQQMNLMELKYSLHTTKARIQFMQTKYEEDICHLGTQLRSLSNAASQYQRVVQENCKLYNQVQDLKGSIRVYCRVRPFLSSQLNHLSSVIHMEEGNITVATKSGIEGGRSFRFNKVFGPYATQEEVFLDTQPLIRSVLDGYNVCMFAYGQTGAGKTYTMSGPNNPTEESLGVNYRALSDLFNLSEQRKNTISYDISVQMIEIYNEQVRDLLAPDGSNKRLEIRNSSQKGKNVPDASIVSVSSTSDVIRLMNLGQNNRHISSTALNDTSSRSHSCLTVHVQGRNLISGIILHGCMHLVDLAGSERVDKSKVTGARLKESQHINRSLAALGDVIASLAQKNTHVPYRNSKLTQLLQDSLGGQAKTLMFVHISPEFDALGETITTLKFAERVSNVELGAARINKDGADAKELKEQIATLKAALARKEREPVRLVHSHSSSPTTLREMEDVSNDEVGNNSALKPNRQSFDLHDLLIHKTAWAESDCGEKEMLNKKDWREDGQLLCDHSDDDDEDGSGDFEAATTENSVIHQLNFSKPANIANGLGSKSKMPHPKAAKSPEIRSSIPVLCPAVSRKVPNRNNSPFHRPGRVGVSIDTKRKNMSGK